MGPSLSLWLYRTRARLSEADAPPLPAPAEDAGTGPAIWLHCPNAMARPALTELIRVTLDARPDLRVLQTYPMGTDPVLATEPQVSAVALAADTPGNARTLMQQWRPRLGLLCSDALPPALITEAAQNKVILSLFADGPPERGLPDMMFRGRVANALVHRFDRVFLKAPQWAEPLRRYGVPATRLEVTGPLSEGSHALPCNEAERDALARGLAGRPTWLAMQVTRAETPMAIAAHAFAARKSHRLLLILVPDDPARGPEMAQELRAKGWTVGLRSDDEDPDDETQIYIADLDGERGLWFRLAPISFLGQTHGSGTPPDPFEPAALGSAILHGPTTGAQSERYLKLSRAGAAREVRNDKDLGTTLAELLAPDQAAAMAHSGWDISSQGAEATERLSHWIQHTLDRAEAS